MKIPRSWPWLIVSVFCGAVGYWSGTPRQELAGRVDEEMGMSGQSGRRSHDRRGLRTSETVDALVSPELRGLIGNESLTNSSAHRVTMRVLEEADPVRRATAVGLILDSMTPANASAIRQGFLDITIETGRVHDGEWGLMVRKFGETMGKAALDEIKSNPLESSSAFEGWAMADPNGALEHFRKMDPSDPTYRNFCSSLLTGIARTDPGKSFKMLLDDPDMTVDTRGLLNCAVQTLGMEGAGQALQNSLDQAGPEASRSDAFRSIFNQLANTMMHQNWTSGKSENVLPWLEQQKGQPFLTNQVVNHAVMDVALQGKVTVALNWLDRMNEGDDQKNLGRDGVCNAVLRDPTLLAKADEATFDRVIALLPADGNVRKSLADRLAQIRPDYAARLAP
jgi:hypothetical protein